MVKTLNKGLALVTAVVVGGILSGKAVLAATDYAVPVTVDLATSLNVVTTALNFGEIDYTPIGGSIIIDSSGAVSTAANVITPSGISMDDTNALGGSIAITSAATFDVTVSYSDATLVDTGGTALVDLTVTDVDLYSDTIGIPA